MMEPFERPIASMFSFGLDEQKARHMNLPFFPFDLAMHLSLAGSDAPLILVEVD